MDKKIAGLLGAAAALSTMHTAQAATEPENRSAPAASYRDLLEPVPNALQRVPGGVNRDSQNGPEERV